MGIRIYLRMVTNRRTNVHFGLLAVAVVVVVALALAFLRKNDTNEWRDADDDEPYKFIVILLIWQRPKDEHCESNFCFPPRANDETIILLRRTLTVAAAVNTLLLRPKVSKDTMVLNLLICYEYSVKNHFLINFYPCSKLDRLLRIPVFNKKPHAYCTYNNWSPLLLLEKETPYRHVTNQVHCNIRTLSWMLF